MKNTKKIYVVNGEKGKGYTKDVMYGYNIPVMNLDHGETYEKCTRENTREATTQEVFNLWKETEVQYTPYKVIKQAVRSLVFEYRWRIDDLIVASDDPDFWDQEYAEELWNKIQALQWAGFADKGVVIPFGIPDFAYKYEAKLWKEMK